MQEIQLTLFSSVRSEPLTHLLVSPIPLKRVRIAAVVFGPGSIDMLHELFLAPPGITFHIPPFEGPDEHFRLVQPRGMNRSKAGTPPIAMVDEVLFRCSGCMSGVAVLNQIDSLEITMTAAEILQRLDVMDSIFVTIANGSGPAGAPFYAAICTEFSAPCL